MERKNPEFESWFEELKDIAIKSYEFTQAAVDSLDKAAYLEYYNDGYTACDAIYTDLQNA